MTQDNKKAMGSIIKGKYKVLLPSHKLTFFVSVQLWLAVFVDQQLYACASNAVQST